MRYPMGSRVTGKVVRLTDFGAFVELEPGVDGLLHISQMSYRPIASPAEIVNVGDELTLLVIRVDPERAAHRPRAQGARGASIDEPMPSELARAPEGTQAAGGTTTTTTRRTSQRVAVARPGRSASRPASPSGSSPCSWAPSGCC